MGERFTADSRDNRSDGSYSGQVLGIFARTLEHMEISLPSHAGEAIGKWLTFYSRWEGRRVVGFEEPDDVAVKLLADSFAVAYLKGLGSGLDGIDLGSGNGWPGLAAKVLGICSHVSLLDSRQGACDFMQGFLDNASMPGAQVIQDRAEQAAHTRELRESYSLVMSRAMAEPGIALELCSGLIKVGGKAVLWMGPNQQIPKGGHGLKLAGLSFEEEVRYTLPNQMGKRVLAVYSKACALGKKYPRRYAAIRKKPLI